MGRHPGVSCHERGGKGIRGWPCPSAGRALLLPVADWQVGPAATGSNSEQARTAILAALNGETELYGAPVNSHGDTGWTTWEEYIQLAYPYSDAPLQITRHVWQDLNGDGQEECVLQMEAVRGDTEHTENVVLSEQDGTVYAYYFGFLSGADLLYSDGTFRTLYTGTALSFWRGHCYQYFTSFWGGACYHAPPPDTAAQPVEWVEGAPGT